MIPDIGKWYKNDFLGVFRPYRIWDRPLIDCMELIYET